VFEANKKNPLEFAFGSQGAGQPSIHGTKNKRGDSMRKAIDTKYLTEITTSLENIELGAAIRILTKIVSSAKSVSGQRAHVIAQMSLEEWEAVSDEVLQYFIIGPDLEITHRALLEGSMPAIETIQNQSTSSTSNLPIVELTRRIVAPQHPRHDATARLSIKRTAYIIMVKLFERSHQSENTARAAMASLLQAWPEGHVYDAVATADRQEHVVDPRSWILGHLRANSSPLVNKKRRFAKDAETAAPAPRRHRSIDPQSLGVSQSTVDRMRDKKSVFKMKIGETS
jgi:hypothetical protein